MATPSLPPDIHRLLLTSIPSVPFLEALLLLHRNAPTWLSPGEVARRLYLSEAGARTLLDSIVAAGMAEGSEPGYRFASDDAERAELIARLGNCWSSHLLEMTHLIHDNTLRKGTRFADAFKLRSKE